MTKTELNFKLFQVIMDSGLDPVNASDALLDLAVSIDADVDNARWSLAARRVTQRLTDRWK